MKRPRSRLLEAVHESARDLHRAGLITQRRLRTFDALCSLEVSSLSAAQISGGPAFKRLHLIERKGLDAVL
ncbi:MAG: hypothetical protein ACYDDA_00350 [Acidiferrobacteraceae bacterium]